MATGTAITSQPLNTAPLLDQIAALRRLPSYDALLAYRDLVRLEAPVIRTRLPDPVIRKKYDNYLSTYERTIPARHFTDHNYAQKLTPVVDLVRSPGIETVIDVACGNGFEAVLFALFGKTVRANDCTIERTTITRTRAEFYRELVGEGFSVSTSLANVMAAAPKLGRHDLVFVQEAISHIHPAEEFLALARDHLIARGGRLAVCDSNGWNPVTRVRISRHLWAERRTLRHYIVELVDVSSGASFLMAEERLFSAPTMKRMMRSVGLTPELTWMSGFSLPLFVRSRTSGIARTIDEMCRRIPGIRSLGGFYTIVASTRQSAKQCESA